jgi:hypothetical protein
MALLIKLNATGVDQILKVEAAPMIKAIADRIANTAESVAGSPSGHRVVMTRYDEPTPERARSAIVVSHSTSAGRQAGIDALKAAMKVAG